MSELDQDPEFKISAPADEVSEHMQEDEDTAYGSAQELPGGLRGGIEAVLMVIDEPITAIRLATAMQVPLAQVETALSDLEESYTRENRGFALKNSGGGWRIYSRSEYADVVARFLMDGQATKLSQASLETLAVIAYRQPVSRSRISAVRGVNVDGVVRTLQSRGLIEEIGSADESTATLYGTTNLFLERLGLNSLDELPALAPYLPEIDVLDEIAESGRH